MKSNLVKVLSDSQNYSGRKEDVSVFNNEACPVKFNEKASSSVYNSRSIKTLFQSTGHFSMSVLLNIFV